MIVFGATEAGGLGWETAKQMNADVGKIESKKFPDGELYMRVLSDVKGKDCAVIRSIRTSDDLVGLILLLDALRENKAKMIHCVTPYLTYMRQDKMFASGEPISAKTVLRIIDELADDITTVNCHFNNEPGRFAYHNIVLRNIDATPALVDYFKGKVSKPTVIAPDKGSLAYAKRAAEQLDCEFNHLSKKRVSGEKVVIEDKKLDVRGKDVIMLDDIISTGGTIVEAAKVIRDWKPNSINVGCVHGLFLKGIEQFKGVVDRVVSTNTLETPVSKVNVAKLIITDLKSNV